MTPPAIERQVLAFRDIPENTLFRRKSHDAACGMVMRDDMKRPLPAGHCA
ncbi:hypothetical protein [Burkholderia territorii]|nr:hypothetical protein [Burkholderia territorii]